MKKKLILMVLFFFLLLQTKPLQVVAEQNNQVDIYEDESKAYTDVARELLNLLLNFGRGGPTSDSQNPPGEPGGSTTPPGGSTPGIDVAGGSYGAELAQAIIAACGEHINDSNKDCLDRANIDDRARAELKDSAHRFQQLQCVGFVSAISLGQGGATMQYHGNANALPSNPPSGYTFIPKGSGTIGPGDFPIWSSGSFGHIAYVVAASADGVQFKVVEANYCRNSCGKIGVRDTSIDSNGFVGWLRKS